MDASSSTIVYNLLTDSSIYQVSSERRMYSHMKYSMKIHFGSERVSVRGSMLDELLSVAILPRSYKIDNANLSFPLAFFFVLWLRSSTHLSVGSLMYAEVLHNIFNRYIWRKRSAKATSKRRRTRKKTMEKCIHRLPLSPCRFHFDSLVASPSVCERFYPTGQRARTKRKNGRIKILNNINKTVFIYLFRR